jgi:Tfp pilus assembly protein PilO
MGDIRMPSTGNGRRGSDIWSRAGRIIGVLLSVAAALGMTGQLWLKGHQIEINRTDIADIRSTVVTVTERVTVLEQFKKDDHYMTCFMFQKVNPDGVPASCESALRHK